MDTISPRVPATKLLAVVDTIIGVLNQRRFNAAQRFVRGGHLMTLRYSMAAFAALACIGLGGSTASASTVCLNATHGATNYGPDTSCATSAESEVFLQSQTDTMTGFGNIGSQTGLPLVEFMSTNALDLANGNATITPAAKGGKASFANLDITIPGHTFTDLIFDVQMLNAFSSTGESLTVSAWDGSTLERTFTYDTLAHDADINFIVADASGLTAVDLSSPTGLKQAKHFDVSGVDAIPESSTWSMMLLGFAGLGYAAWRGGRKQTASIIEA
jgi:hypothetical protein